MPSRILHVIVATGEWHEDRLRYRRHRLAEFLRKQPTTEDVIWVCPSNRVDSKETVTRLENNILQYEITDLLPYRFTRFMRYHELFYRYRLYELRKIMNESKAERKVLWFTFPGFPGLIDMFNWDSVIYDCSDLWRAPINGNYDLVSRFREKSVKAVENKIIKSSKMITCSSQYLADKIMNENQVDLSCLQVIENGVEISKFKNSKDVYPNQIEGIKGPLLGYVGGLKPKIDFNLLSAMVTIHPDWNIVLIGPRHYMPDKNFEVLINKRNVHWIGSIPPHDVPFYMKQLDVGLLPYKNIEYNKAVFPLKLFEYLSVGVPVVGTGIPSTEKYKKKNVFTYVGDTPSLFISACEDALINQMKSEDKLKRIDFAKDFDWETKLEKMVSLGSQTYL